MILRFGKRAKRHVYSSFDRRDARIMQEESSASLRDRSGALRGASILLSARNREGRVETERLRMAIDDLRGVVDALRSP